MTKGTDSSGIFDITASHNKPTRETNYLLACL